MKERVVIVLATTNPEDGTHVGSVLLQAMAAAALEYDVEVVFAGVSAALATPGSTEKICIGPHCDVSVRAMIREAHAAGVLFKVCPPSFLPWNDDTIPEIDDTVGNAYLIQRAVDDGTTVLTY